MDECMDKDIIKVRDFADENGYFIDDFADLELQSSDEIVGGHTMVDLGATYSEGVYTLDEVKKIGREIIIEAMSQMQLEIDKINYLIDVLENNIGIVKRNEDVRSGKIKPAKKGVSDIEVEMDYMDGLSCLQIARKYGFTEDGIRKRLKKIGVYKSEGRKNNKS